MAGDRVCALGASDGRYLMNWIESQWPDRFRCLVNYAGVIDVRAMYYQTDEMCNQLQWQAEVLAWLDRWIGH